jgi:hypothetical protein
METGDKQVEYISQTAFKTKDNYTVKIKAVVAFIGETEKNIFKSIENSLQGHIKSITLMEALDLVNEDHFVKLLPLINKNLGDEKVTEFAIKTVDAVEAGEEPDIAIDPSLETQTQKKGVLGKLKSLFGK